MNILFTLCLYFSIFVNKTSVKLYMLVPTYLSQLKTKLITDIIEKKTYLHLKFRSKSKQFWRLRNYNFILTKIKFYGIY